MAAKYQNIAEELRIQIRAGQYASAAFLPTEFELCRVYNVSRQTVRQALSLLVDEGLIERRQGSGSRIVRHSAPEATKPRTVAVVATYISDYIFPGTLREVERVLSAQHCSTLLFSTQNRVDNERRILLNLLNKPVDGILVEGSKTALPNPNLDLYRSLMARGTPLVFFHGMYPDLPEALCVLDDNRGGGRMLVEYLHGKGHTNIAGIFKSDDIQGLRRYEGYISALRDLSLPMSDAQVYWYDTAAKELLMTSDEALHKAEQVLDGCTAVVCYNDEIASRLVGDLVRRGVRVPQEKAVVSFDNSRYSDLAPVSITSLSHGENNVGRLAAEQLVRLMHGEPARTERAPWILTEKESS